MTFKDEIKKTITSCGNPVKIYSKNKCVKGYCLFKQISKTKEQYYEQIEPNSVGQIVCSTYSVWLVSNSKISSMEYIVCNEKKYDVIFKKYRKETGCFELIVFKRSYQSESIWNFKKNNWNNSK